MTAFQFHTAMPIFNLIDILVTCARLFPCPADWIRLPVICLRLAIPQRAMISTAKQEGFSNGSQVHLSGVR